MSDDEVLGERQHLQNLAFRMLGTAADAEDVAQETYARWFRLIDAERAGIRSPQAWLTRVASNICLDLLGSARHRREQYVGEWLPEPLAADALGAGSATADPLERVTLDDSVTMALLVVLESLTPAERVAFVLHDVFAVPFDEIAEVVGRTPQAARKLASTARKHVAERRQREATAEKHTAVVKAFWAACEGGDLAGLVRLLDPDVVTLVDGGGTVSAALRPIRGAEKVSRYVLGSLSKAAELRASLETVSGRVAVVLRLGEAVAAVVSFEVKGDLITDLWLVMTPDKLTTFRSE